MAPSSMEETQLPDELTDEDLYAQVQLFLDDWYHRLFRTSVAKKWPRGQVYAAALDIFELNGVQLSKQEREALTDGHNEEQLLQTLVSRMPKNLRENFPYFAQTMQMVVTTITRMRDSLEEENFQAAVELLESGDKEAVSKNVMKRTVVCASEEIQKIRRCQDSWNYSMERRLARMAYTSQLAVQQHEQALLTEARLSSFVSSHASKSKKMLLGLAEGKDKAFINDVFGAWRALGEQLRREQKIRAEWEAEAQAVEAELLRCKESQVTNVRNVLLRNCQEGDLGLLNVCVDLWSSEVAKRKAEGDTAAAIRMAEERLKSVGDEKKKATKSLLQKMANDTDGALVLTMWQAWVQHHEDCLKEKELAEAVKKTEAALMQHLEKKKDEAKVVLDRLAGSSDSGLLAMAISYWQEGMAEERRIRDVEMAAKANEDRLKRMAMRQIGTATGVQTRVNEQMGLNLLLQCIYAWRTHTKVKHLERYYIQKIEGKRKQLHSVQSLFKSFAMQLEAGLGNLEGDSSDRPSKKVGSRSQSATNLRGDSLHLPDINARPVLA